MTATVPDHGSLVRLRTKTSVDGFEDKDYVTPPRRSALKTPSPKEPAVLLDSHLYFFVGVCT